MNKFISIISLLSLFGFGSPAFAANEIKLLEISSVDQDYNVNNYSTHFDALVANLAYAKQINVHAQLANGTWTDIPLSYNRAANNNLEVWSTDLYDYGTSRFGNTLAFALSYTVNGVTYWDNNNGANYVVPVNAGVLLYNTNVYNLPINAYAYIYGNRYTGAVTVKNIAPTKDVKVVYSTDGWATSQTAAASFSPSYWSYSTLTNPSPYGFEEWSYSLDVGSTATRIDYAISYTVNGQTYWDNNFGHNYTATLVRNGR